ncbi:MAG: PLD nuclease N-terminal domain-containing protein [Xanthomonadaceae bacterium]|jgi:hypothetical protein|nr:PLD nuclease N-terminal domain-containing protein [Xanthomonadaceae bacterium]
MSMEVNGILGLLLLVAIVYALIQIVQSAAGTGAKVLWAVLVLLFPLIGVIVWFFLGPRPGRA